MNTGMAEANGGDALLFGGGTMLRGAGDGSVRALASATAPVRPSTAGLFVGDTRLLSHLSLSLGKRDLAVASRSDENSQRRLVFVPMTGRNETADVLVSLTQRVSPAGLDEQITLVSTSSESLELTLDVHFAADFADQFALRSDRRTFDRSGAVTTTELAPGSLTLLYRRERDGLSFEAGLVVESLDAEISALEPAVELTSGRHPEPALWRLTHTVTLGPGGSQSLSVSFHSVTVPSEAVVNGLVRTDDRYPSSLRARALDDLEALRMPAPTAAEFSILAAGVPWFLTLFGRDSLIASLLAATDLPGVIDDVLRALAATQSTTTDRRRVAEPGKIVHELRGDELATLDQIPYGRYYGSVDSTPLFLIGLATCDDRELVASLEPAARAAVGWMLGSGGLAEFGFLRYVPDPDGLLHQGWKDSFDAIAHSDGSLAEGAIALCEVQGYAWRALTDTARLARSVWGDPVWADELSGVADALRARFRAEFWMPAADFPALALDGAGDKVEVIASNAGHLLFSGILDGRDAYRVTARLLEPDMFTGWGIRTLSSNEVRYHPLSYHNGSVWPHDTMLTAIGMARHGFHDEAAMLAEAVEAAAAHFGWRLPELFGGFSRATLPEPVALLHAASPQAWAAAAGVAAASLVK